MLHNGTNSSLQDEIHDVTRIGVIRVVPVWMTKALHFLSIYSSLLSKETVEP